MAFAWIDTTYDNMPSLQLVILLPIVNAVINIAEKLESLTSSRDRLSSGEWACFFSYVGYYGPASRYQATTEYEIDHLLYKDRLITIFRSTDLESPLKYTLKARCASKPNSLPALQPGVGPEVVEQRGMSNNNIGETVKSWA